MMIGYGISGSTHDFFARNSSNAVWNGAAFVAWSDADYASYRITATESGTSGRFTGTEPTGTASYELRLRAGTLAGSTVLWSDTTDNASADAVFDRADGIETNYTFRQVMRLIASVLLAKTSNGQKTFRDLNDTKDRVTATLASDGDRTVVTRDAT